jgi:hypothetical protein
MSSLVTPVAMTRRASKAPEGAAQPSPAQTPQEYLVGAAAQPHEVIVGLDVPVDEALAVQILNSRELQARGCETHVRRAVLASKSR